MSDAQAATPHLRIVRGTPSSEELAALVAVIAAASATAPATAKTPASRWAASRGMVRSPLPTGGWSRSMTLR